MAKKKLTPSVNRNGHYGLDRLLVASVLLQMINGLYCVGYKTFVPSPRFDLSDPTTFVDYRPFVKRSNNGFKSFKQPISQRYDLFKRSHPVSIPMTPFIVERGSIRVHDNGKIVQEKIIMPTIFKRLHTSHYHPEHRPKISIQTVPVESHFTEGLHAPYFKDDQPFKPIMVPSPPNLEPMKPPTFQTTRSKVQEIRERNKAVLHAVEPDANDHNKREDSVKPNEGFEISRAKVEEIRNKHQDFLNHKVDENKGADENKGTNEIFYAQYEEPNGNTINEAIPVTEDVDEPPFDAFKPMLTSNKRSDPPPSQLEKELSYFQSREKELESIEETQMTTTTMKPKQRLRRVRVKPTKASNKDANEEKETKVTKQRIRKKPDSTKAPFVPIKRYAQVRHQIKETHLPAGSDEESDEDAGRLKERITTLKRHTVRSEEGSENINYDHGGEESEKEFNVTEITLPHERSDRQRRRRYKRDVNFSDNEGDEDEEVIPMALALVQSKNGPRLSGNELLAYISEVIKNSTIYAPDEEDDTSKPKLINKSKIGAVFSIPIKKPPPRTPPLPPVSETKTNYNFYNLPSDIKRRPVQSVSPYERNKNQICDEDEDDDDDDDDESGSEQESRERSRPPMWNHRMKKRLGGRIECMKNKYFGKNPFNNAFFQEEFIESPQSHSLRLKLLSDGSIQERTPQTSNHLVTVYDDIIHNIKHTLTSDEDELEADDDSSSEESDEVDEHLSFEATRTRRRPVDSVNSESHRNNKIFNTITDTNIKEFSLLKSTDALPAYTVFDITQYFPKALATLPLEPDTKTGFRTKTKLDSYRKPTDTPDLDVLKVVPSPSLVRPPNQQPSASSTKIHSSHYSAQNQNRAPVASKPTFRTKSKPLLPPLQRRKRYRYETIIFI